MVASIPSSAVSQGNVPHAGSDAGAVALQAQLTRCERQLGDWEACASSKTPEGRKIIENLRARIGTLESKIASSGKAPGPAEAPSSAPRGGDTTSGARGSFQAYVMATSGRLLDVFA
jgi:hypothetical protein